MPTQRTVNTQAMLSAAESGAAAKQRAAELVSREADSSRQQTAQLAESVGRGVQAQSQINEQARANQAREGLEQQGLAETVRRNQMGEAIQQDAQDIEMADRGLEASGPSRADTLRQGQAAGGGAAGAQQPMQDPEEQANASRYSAQSEKGLEVAGPERRTIAPTEARTAKEGSTLSTNRLNAQANYMNAVRNFNESKLKGKDGEDSMKKELQNLQQPIKEAARMFDLGKKNELSPNQWSDIEALAADAPDPALQQEVKSKQWGPALSRFMQARVSQASIQFMAVTGDMPDGDLVDLASPAMRQFTQSAEQMQAYLRAADAGGLLSGSLGIQSMADRNRMVRKLTARAMLQQKSQPQPSGGALIPSQGGARARPNTDPSGPVQRGLQSREQSVVDQQVAGDEQRRRDAGTAARKQRLPTESFTRDGIRIPR